MLLAHEVPEDELEWFRSRGILIYQCAQLVGEGITTNEYPAVVWSKLYLFQKEFKKWKNIVSLDADVIVRASLHDLTEVSGFSAPDSILLGLKRQFVKEKDPERFEELAGKYRLKGGSFNTGIFAFNTDVIEENTFIALMDLTKKFGHLNRNGEEATLNLLFYKKWESLPMIYNAYPHFMRFALCIRYRKIRAIIVHFVLSRKPWDEKSPFHKEWLDNLTRADSIDLSHRPQAAKVWSAEEKESIVSCLKRRRIICSPLVGVDWMIGKMGLLVKAVSPRIYEKMRLR